MTPTYDDQDPVFRDVLGAAAEDAPHRQSAGPDPTRTFPAAPSPPSAYGPGTAPVRATAPTPVAGTAPAPPPPPTRERQRSRAGAIAGWVLLAITLIVSAVVAIITSTTGFTLDNTIRDRMVDSAVPYYWFVLGAVWIAFAGLLVAAVASCRSGGRLLAAVVLWLLTGVSIVLMPIVAQIGSLRTPETMADLYRVTPGLVVMFAAGTWLAAGRRSAFAPFTAILGLPLGIALQVVPDGQWPGSGPPESGEVIEPYFLDPELVLWPIRGGGYWILLLAIVVIVWLGVGVDALASPRSRAAVPAAGSSTGHHVLAAGTIPSPAPARPGGYGYGYGYGPPAPSTPGQAYSQIPQPYLPHRPTPLGAPMPYGGPHGPAPQQPPPPPTGPPPAPMPAPVDPSDQQRPPHGRPAPQPGPPPAQPPPQAYSAWLPAPPGAPGTGPVPPHTGRPAPPHGGPAPQPRTGPGGPPWKTPRSAGSAPAIDDQTVARGFPVPAPGNGPAEDATVARGIPLAAPQDGVVDDRTVARGIPLAEPKDGSSPSAPPVED